MCFLRTKIVRRKHLLTSHAFIMAERFVQKFIDVKFSYFSLLLTSQRNQSESLFILEKFMMSCRDLMCDINIEPVL